MSPRSGVCNVGSYLSLNGVRLDIEAIDIEGWIYDDSGSGAKWSLNVEGRESTFDEDLPDLIPSFYDQCLPVQVADWTHLEHKTMEFDIGTNQGCNEPTFCLVSSEVLPMSVIHIGERQGNRFRLHWAGLADVNVGEYGVNVPFSIDGYAVMDRFGVRFWESEDGTNHEDRARRIMRDRGVRDDNMTFVCARRFSDDVDDPYYRLMIVLFRPV